MPSRRRYHHRHSQGEWRTAANALAVVGLWLLVGSSCRHNGILGSEAAVSDGDGESDEVTGLLGQPQVSFKHYAGYVTVSESHGRALFYWFFESSQKNYSQMPLVLWLNGGPGCSSVGNGALGEMGPFFTNDSGTGLTLNKHAWNRAANIIFLESPYGTGFSYSNTSSDYEQLNDEPVAEDAHAFLIGWFRKFPEYAKNDFYLVGESYAGHYIPTLARVIVRENRASTGFQINFKGFAIGNPWTDAYSDNLGTTEFYFSHSLISEETYNTIRSNCDFKNSLPVDAGSTNATCNSAVSEADMDMSKIDIYNIYGPACNSNNSIVLKRGLYEMSLLVGAYNPCLDSVTPYLNLPSVQAALHISSPRSWVGCSSVVFRNYSKSDMVNSMIPVYQELLKENLRIWIYSGDTDGVVSTLGTRRWIKELNLTVQTPWYAWDYNNQVGGWTQEYDGLTFVTVRGAGHLVPFVQPGPAFALFGTFLAGQSLPKF
ncbi:hypothetical protein KP509_18G008000 [Ceratopteris richardii]|uniref:Carboxypeptidase n=2 Tax=Ceratopteris richardii TaxID=49495 RepID=A0A8T2SN49_CERRI|nr:hypothetical protein KP509_18G008000 [Ceratopteris richardii]KAH7365081.1 hypothetical protein KP509_18G008000 [Ceratopteris richardii]KAH7365082.1 hypothetical protein KP509_18G008000 [Ceratopteris richardii]KAH7365084.1 hypothetical protein KP509_18G008000 [Ceratopteris richardii]